jgi:peptidoglycan hydrolase CwlO-like protein
MKKIFFMIVLALGLLTAYGHAEMDEHMMHHDMMGGAGMEMEEEMPDEYMMYPCEMCGGMMGYRGYGMREGCGMMGHGMMGRGMWQGMWGYGYQQKAFQKFLDVTKDLRKQLHDMKFEYFELARNPETKPEDIDKLKKEMQELQKKIFEKMPQ